MKKSSMQIKISLFMSFPDRSEFGDKNPLLLTHVLHVDQTYVQEQNSVLHVEQKSNLV